MSQPRYRIQTVTQRTGIPSATLRAWERRYGFPKPSRADGSTYRLYSEQDILDILEIKALCEEGMSPSDAVTWLRSTHDHDDVSPDLETEHLHKVLQDPSNESNRIALQKILDATRRFDHLNLEKAVREATLLGSGRRVFEEVFAPALREIGDQWHQGILSIGQEHLATELIESATRDMLRIVQPDQAPLILLACIENEQHALPLYGSAFLFTQWGYRVCILGANTPPQALKDSVIAMKPQAIGISITQQNPQIKTLLPLYADACGTRPWIVGGMSVSEYQEQIENLGGKVVSTENLSKIRAHLESKILA